MNNKRHGFTFIKLAIVIIILGIIVAVGAPKFIDLTSDAKQAATNSVAAALTAANRVNYAAHKENPTKGIAIVDCKDVATTLQKGLPKGFTIIAAAVAVGETSTCTLTGPKGTTATFTATGIH